MRNPIQKRLENLESWQHLTFMACLCERMLPNFQLFCQVTQQEENARIFQNILNLVWESLTIKGAKINFESQLEKFENAIPDVNDYDFYGILPAVDACEGLSELLHAIIAGETLEKSVNLSQLSLQTVAVFLENQFDRELKESELKEHEHIQAELDTQWQIYRLLKDCEERNVELIWGLKNELRADKTSNIGIKIDQ